jgi:hypothetical protein
MDVKAIHAHRNQHNADLYREAVVRSRYQQARLEIGLILKRSVRYDQGQGVPTTTSTEFYFDVSPADAMDFADQEILSTL